MPDRAYTLSEIDRMRQAVEHRWLYGTSISNRGSDVINTAEIVSGETVSVHSYRTSRIYDEAEKTACVEEMLRSYMFAGLEPEEIE